MTESPNNTRAKTVAVLAVQGAFIEHEQMLSKLGVETFEIRQLKDLDRHFDGLILPGGESTVQGKLLRDLGLFEPLKKRIQDDLPVFGTCAGLILLAEKLSNDTNTYFGTLPVTVQRNAYGRQLGSFYTEEQMKYVGKIPMTFIRAPVVNSVSNAAKDAVDVLAVAQPNKEVDPQIVAVRYKNQLGITFHPELNDDLSIHKYFVEML